MAMPVRVGVTLPVPPDPAASLETADWAEQRGFDDVWFADGGDSDALTLAAAVAQRTSRLRIGTAVVPVYTRTPSVMAASAATLSHLAPGRFVLGLGSSSQPIVEAWGGVPFEKPLTRVRETTRLLRGMFAGEKTDFAGETLRSTGFALKPLPKEPVPIYLAALRARMLEMAAAAGDGVVINLFPLDALPQIMQHIRIGAERAGKRVEDLEIVCRFQVLVTDDLEEGRALFRRRFAPYYATSVYNRFLAWCGYEDVARDIREGWAARDRDRTTGALENTLIDNIAIMGTAEQCRQQVRAFLDGGVTTAVIGSFGGTREACQAAYEAFAPDVFRYE